MMIRKSFLIAVCILFSALVFAQEKIPLVSVSGEGIVKVVPDEVTINARVEHTGDSAALVKRENEQVVNEIFKFLKSKGIPSGNIQTEYIRLDKQYNYDSKKYYFSANQAISIKLNNLGKYEEIMSGLMESGLNRIDGIAFQTSKKTALEAQARKEAMLDAKEKATQLASAIGLKIGKAFTIDEIVQNHVQPVFRMSAMKEANDAQQTIAPGEMKIIVRVNVSFLLDQNG